MEAILRKTLARACALVLGAGVFLGSSAFAAPVPAGSPAIGRIASSTFLQVARVCEEPCPDCTDCIPEIDVAPDRDDPIAREIEKLGPPRANACEDKIVPGRRGTPDADACGVRCWYWRLRHGYCGPGCDYYRYRMHEYPAGKPGHHDSRYACHS